MNVVLYLYFAHPSEAQVRSLLSALKSRSLIWARLDKIDPPRKFDGNIDDALSIIVSGEGLTNYTFGEISEGRLGVDFALRNNDSRWDFSTISISGLPAELMMIIEPIFSESLDVYLAISGFSGKGPDQEWNVLRQSSRCPRGLLDQVGAA